MGGDALSRTDTKPARDAEGPHYRRAWRIVLGLAVAAAVYYVVFLFIGYTDDAYVWSDVVAIAPEIAGPIQSVSVHDNQPVAAGDLVATIDPRPFQLAVALKASRVADLEAAVAVKQAVVVADASRVDAATAALVYAQAEYDRISVLTRDQALSQADLDKASDVLRTAKDRLADRKASLLVDQQQVDAARTTVAVAESDLALARYDLSRTRLASSVRGYVNNLNLRPGDYARIGEGIVGVVDADRWRVIANFKEEVAAPLPVGKRVWIWLDSDPWHIWAGKVQGVGRGIARSPEAARLLPYVAPTTDWIRLRRRLQVTIFFDAPAPTQQLFMGADARVLLFR